MGTAQKTKFLSNDPGPSPRRKFDPGFSRTVRYGRTAGRGFHTGENMKTLCILFWSILLAPLVALSQGGFATMMVHSRTIPASASGQTQLLADFLESQIAIMLMDKYPCAKPTSASAVRDTLDLNRQRQLLGSDTDADMQSLAQAIGVQYLITITVTELGSGGVAMNASMMNANTGKTQQRAGNVAGGGEAAFDAAEAFAKQFVDSLGNLPQFSKSNCDPTNPWAGTITYHLVQNHEENSERKAISGEGTVTTTFRNSSTYDVKIKIGWTGQPQAFITANGFAETVEVGKVRIDCARSTIARRKPEWKSAGWNNLSRMEDDAWGDVVAKVSVTLANDQYRIDLSLPEIQGTTKVIMRKHSDGGCGNPSDNNPAPVQVPYKIKVSLPVIERRLPKMDTLAGSDTDPKGGFISWSLTRTPMRQ